ncbi:hypothetical protein A4A49_06820 [Nicotiana attenuata]|uniref:Uncharacterized protein n=1 Tax=Nicotiana attenuata TaxID=49451 RepID=A0A314KUS5_NICAT|nr:hypothetical protein A4A49_06820 [Nicotiana attenuata]
MKCRSLKYLIRGYLFLRYWSLRLTEKELVVELCRLVTCLIIELLELTYLATSEIIMFHILLKSLGSATCIFS